MNKRTIFLLDGLGASLSCALTGLILPHFSAELGLSKQVLYTLAAFPAIFLIFSFSCYGLIISIKSWMLLTIILANLFYCLVSASLIIFYPGLSDLGTYLLSAEIVVVIFVIALELTVYRALLKA